MKKIKLLVALALLLGLEKPVLAQAAAAEQPPSPDSIQEETTGSAADLRISPRLGVSHTSSGGGFDGITRLEGFIPLWQTPGRNITFLDAALLIDNGANLGGNVVIGHRFYDAKTNRTWGGYFAADNRKTDDSDFYQLGLGFESLGEIVDFRVNGYLPIGETSDLIDEQTTDSGTRTSTQFQGHRLLLTNEQIRQTSQLWESALGGFDAEVGARVARWNDGDLRAFGGVYYYGGAHTSDAWGWRLRLEAHPIDYLSLGAALQRDDLFGTNFTVSVGLSFPRTHPRPAEAPATVATRLGESVVRAPNIIVNQQTETDVDVERIERPLMNPEEEQPYRFQHVTLGRSGGNGTVERPFGTVQAALDATRSDGNDVVYVDRGKNRQIPAFTIPDRVQVLSQAPVQILAGMPFPGFPSQPVRLPFSPTTNFSNGILVRLPLSNDGHFPQIRDQVATDLVTLGNRTTLAGFRLADAAGNGIVGRDVTDTELRDNTITNADRGVLLDGVVGSVVMFDNTITGSDGGAGSGQGILIQNNADDSVEVTLERHQLANNRVGIELAASGATNQRQDTSQTINISETHIQNNREQGLQLSAERFGNQLVQFRDGTIRSNGGHGVQLNANSAGSQEFTIERSTISQNAGDGIRMVGGSEDGSGTAAQEVFIRNNVISNNGGDGIRIIGNELVAQEAAIGNNQILDNAGAGIRGTANNSAFQEYVTDATNGSLGISNNVITGNGDQGIALSANDRATVVADIQQNQSENNTHNRSDIAVTANSNTTDVCVVLVNNTSPSGIRLDNNSTLTVPGFFEVGDLDQVSTRNIGNVEFLPSKSSFTNKPGASSCFQ